MIRYPDDYDNFVNMVLEEKRFHTLLRVVAQDAELHKSRLAEAFIKRGFEQIALDEEWDFDAPWTRTQNPLFTLDVGEIAYNDEQGLYREIEVIVHSTSLP